MSATSLPEGRAGTIEEVDAFLWVLEQVRAGQPLPVVDAEAVTHAVYLELHAKGKPVVRLLPLRDMNEYGAIHGLNVAQLAMAVAARLSFGREEVLAVGLAGLLADVGMVRVPVELMSKSDQLDAAERELIRAHPAAGARIIVEADSSLALPAVVAFEHHLRFDGGGYPTLTYKRMPHRVSRLVQVCDTFHALSSPRPYREPWPNEVIYSFLQQRAGSDFDPEMVTTVISATRET
jgi:HD-GYP domain-containing protein (c-di-GMP phosphodiesterase class II)